MSARLIRRLEITDLKKNKVSKHDFIVIEKEYGSVGISVGTN